MIHRPMADMAATFALTRDWSDAEPGIEVVEIRYAYAQLGEEPDWSHEDARVLVPRDLGPLHRRACAIELPCGLNGAASYTLHYYFLVVRHARQAMTAVASEDIVSREVEWTGKNGARCAGMQWLAAGALEPSYTALTAMAQPMARKAVEPPATRRQRGEEPERRGLCFKGTVWGTQGSEIQYVVLFSGDAASAEQSWDTNGGKGWRVALG